MTRYLLSALGSISLVFLLCGFVVARHPRVPVPVPVIVTAAPQFDELAALRGGERFPQGAQLLRLEDGRTIPLVQGFAASADASVSFDAAAVVFAGKQHAGEPWSIFELTLADQSVRKVTGGAMDAIRPLYLPDGRVVFARRGAAGFHLATVHMDGSAETPLSFVPGNAVPDDVLADGRILFDSPYPLGLPIENGAVPEMFLVYSDGSGVESYRCDHGKARWGGRALASGDVVFTQGASLARFTSRLAEQEAVQAPRLEYAGGAVEMPGGAWLVSARTSAASAFALQTWREGTAATQIVLARKDEQLVQPVLLAARPRPRRHPSALHTWDYANLLALDARVSREGVLRMQPAKVQLETQDANGQAVVLGTAPVEADGSFFVQAPADRPIRFALLDEHGVTLRQEHGWFWIRKGEQRICVGCHAGPEHAPENRVPGVLLRTTMPVDLTGAHQAAMPGGR